MTCYDTHIFPFNITDSLFPTYYFEIYCSFPSTILHNKPIICHFSWFEPCSIFSLDIVNPAQFSNVAAIMAFTPKSHKAVSSLLLFIKIHTYSGTGDELGVYLNWYGISNGIISIQVWLLHTVLSPISIYWFQVFLWIVVTSYSVDWTILAIRLKRFLWTNIVWVCLLL